MPTGVIPFMRKQASTAAVPEVHIIWITAGLGCDGDSVSVTKWANLNVNAPEFNGMTVVEMPVPCTFDFNIAVTKYGSLCVDPAKDPRYANCALLAWPPNNGLESGEIPTSAMFSGTVFHAGRMGLQIAQIPWDRDASYRLPVRVWKEMMDLYYPDTAWMCLEREIFERLHEYKARHGLHTWEQAFERLLGVTAAVQS
jgi:hypothetical protein